MEGHLDKEPQFLLHTDSPSHYEHETLDKIRKKYIYTPLGSKGREASRCQKQGGHPDPAGRGCRMLLRWSRGVTMVEALTAKGSGEGGASSPLTEVALGLHELEVRVLLKAGAQKVLLHARWAR